MSRMLTKAAQQALGRDPAEALTAIRRVRNELDELEESQVANALARGWSWARIGRALGVSRQAVHRKYSDCVPAQLSWTRPGIASNLKVAIAIARTEAASRGDVLVGSEHLLVGLLQQGEGCTAEALRAAGASLRTMRAGLDVLAPSDLYMVKPSQIGLTGRASRALDHAARMALRHQAERITEEHLLRALLQARDSGALVLLTATGVSPVRVRSELDRRTRRSRQPQLTLTSAAA